MFIKKTIVYIDYLNFSSLLMAVVSKCFYQQVRFHNLAPIFKHENMIKCLNWIGIKWCNRAGTKIDAWTQAYTLNNTLSEKVLNDVFKKHRCYQKLVEKLQLDSVGVDKLNASLRRELVGSKWLYEGTASLALLDYLYGDEADIKVLYFSSNLSNYLLAKQASTNIHPKAVLALFNATELSAVYGFKMGFKLVCKTLKKILFFSGKQRVKKTKKSNISNEQPQYCRIGYVPHAGFKYSNLFKKNFIFDEDKDSVFHKDNVVVISLAPLDELTKRYVSFFKIPACAMTLVIGFKKLVGMLKAASDLSSLKNVTFTSLACQFVLSKFYLRTLHYQRGLKNLKALEVVYCFYDILVPNAFLLACYLRSIKTVSHQERTIAATWDVGLIYDLYLVSGEAWVKLMKIRGYSNTDYAALGLPRSSMLQLKPSLDRSRFGDKKIIVCYDLPVCKDIYFLSLTTAITSGDSLWCFYKALIKLAKENKEYHLILKPKSVGTIHQDLQAQTADLDNFEVIIDLKANDSYQLAQLADLIVGKHTSILEECLAAGKKVLCFDNDAYLSSIDYPLKHPGVVVQNYDELRQRAKDILMDGQYLSKEALADLQDNYYKYSDLGYGSAKRQIEMLLSKPVFLKKANEINKPSFTFDFNQAKENV
jgi:hypothetical protein